MLLITTYRNAYLIFNPWARGLNGRRARRIGQALEALRQAGHSVTALETRGRGTAAAIASECIRGGADLILVAGGDGTINEAVNGMIGQPVPLGILPAGTANVLGTELGLRGSTETIARQVGDWIPRRVSTGLLTTAGGSPPRHFLLMAGIGFDAHIVSRVDPDLKKSHGKLSYWIAGLGELARRLDEFEVCVDGTRRPATFALASRVRNYGGNVTIARHAGLDRDDFGLVLIEGRNTFHYLIYLAGALADRLGSMGGASLLNVTSAEFHPSNGVPVYVQVDGELAGRLPARIDIVPDALTLLMPAAARH